MGAHLIDGEFQSDKYPTCPRGKVPLSTKDTLAQPFLWEYAQQHREIDSEFSDDLEKALLLSGFTPPYSAQTALLKMLHVLSDEFDIILETSIAAIDQDTMQPYLEFYCEQKGGFHSRLRLKPDSLMERLPESDAMQTEKAIPRELESELRRELTEWQSK